MGHARKEEITPVPNFTQAGQGQLGLPAVQKARQQRAAHTAGEGHQRAGTQQVADDAGAERHTQPVPGADEHRRQHVDNALHGAAAGKANGNGQGAADHGQRRENSGNGKLLEEGRFSFSS